MKPMKISHASDAQLLEILEDPLWLMQQKMDGARVIIRFSQALEGIEFYNSQGKPLKYAAATLHLDSLREAIHELVHAYELRELTLDGELMLDGTFYAFDTPMLYSTEHLVGHDTPLSVRLRALEHVLYLSLHSGVIRRLPVYHDPSEKRSAFEGFREAGVEGAVFKYRFGTYRTGGERSSTQAKYKFVKDADVVILDRDTKGAKNAVLGVYDDQMNIVQIGSCSMIGKPDLKPGDVARVKYLYWTGGAMIQPRLVEQRHDKLPTECNLEQFPVYSRDVVHFESAK